LLKAGLGSFRIAVVSYFAGVWRVRIVVRTVQGWRASCPRRPACIRQLLEAKNCATSLSPDQRADLVIKEMTLDEKIAVLHGVGMPTDDPLTEENMPSNRGVGYEVGVPRLGIPGIDMSDAAYGVRSSGANGRYSTALPANVAAAASWDTDAAYEYGKLIGIELRAQGYNMTLGGGVDITREPRNGRTFEYLGEDPILAGDAGGAPDSGHAVAACDWRHQALCVQRPGERTQLSEHHDLEAGRARERSAGV
jgi:hypothetical protein